MKVCGTLVFLFASPVTLPLLGGKYCSRAGKCWEWCSSPVRLDCPDRAELCCMWFHCWAPGISPNPSRVLRRVPPCCRLHSQQTPGQGSSLTAPSPAVYLNCQPEGKPMERGERRVSAGCREGGGLASSPLQH